VHKPPTKGDIINPELMDIFEFELEVDDIAVADAAETGTHAANPVITIASTPIKHSIFTLMFSRPPPKDRASSIVCCRILISFYFVRRMHLNCEF
jgi:hypothetical protein